MRLDDFGFSNVLQLALILVDALGVVLQPVVTFNVVQLDVSLSFVKQLDRYRKSLV